MRLNLNKRELDMLLDGLECLEHAHKKSLDEIVNLKNTIAEALGRYQISEQSKAKRTEKSALSPAIKERLALTIATLEGALKRLRSPARRAECLMLIESARHLAANGATSFEATHLAGLIDRFFDRVNRKQPKLYGGKRKK